MVYFVFSYKPDTIMKFRTWVFRILCLKTKTNEQKKRVKISSSYFYTLLKKNLEKTQTFDNLNFYQEPKQKNKHTQKLFFDILNFWWQTFDENP